MCDPALQHRQVPRRRTEREGLIDPRQLGVAQLEIASARVLGGMLGVPGPGDREQRGPAYQEAQGDLTRGRVVSGGDLLQHATASRARPREASRAEGAIAETATSRFSHHGITACSIARSWRL